MASSPKPEIPKELNECLLKKDDAKSSAIKGVTSGVILGAAEVASGHEVNFKSLTTPLLQAVVSTGADFGYNSTDFKPMSLLLAKSVTTGAVVSLGSYFITHRKNFFATFLLSMLADVAAAGAIGVYNQVSQ